MDKSKIILAILLVSIIFLLIFKDTNSSERYSLIVTSSGGFLIFDTKTADMEGCFSKDRDFPNIISCKKIIKLDD